MARILSISASPQAASSTLAVLGAVNRRLAGAGHQVDTLRLRDLPPAALLSADRSDPAIASALEQVRSADALVVATPIYQASYAGLLKVFLDVVPQFGLRGKTVLPLATGGSTAHVLSVDYALRPVLSVLGATVAPGWFVPSTHVRQWPDGGVLLDPASAGPLAQVVAEFLGALTPPAGVPAVAGPQVLTRVDRPAGPPVSPVAGSADLTVLTLDPEDPRLAPLLTDLRVEYGSRYGRDTPNSLLTEVPAGDFRAPVGTFLLLLENGVPVAGGALRRRDPETGEVKRMWTAAGHRRRGLGRRVLAELNRVGGLLGYRELYLTTGPRQPEARALYLAAGFSPLFDLTADPETIGPLPFVKPVSAVTVRPVATVTEVRDVGAAAGTDGVPGREPALAGCRRGGPDRSRDLALAQVRRLVHSRLGEPSGPTP